MSRISGYFLVASKFGGFTIQPWILRPSFDVYQISSVWASSLPASTSSLMFVSCVIVDVAPVFGTENVTMSFGLVGVERIPTATPVLPTAADRQHLLAARHGTIRARGPSRNTSSLNPRSRR